MKFQKGIDNLWFFQIVFGSKNVAKQSCRSMKFQKGGSWIFQNSNGHLGFFQDQWDPKMLLTTKCRSMFKKGGHLDLFKSSKKAAICEICSNKFGS